MMSNQTSSILTVTDFSGGVNYAKEPHKIRDNQLSDLCNMEYRDGVLAKRSGYETLLSHHGVGPVLAAQEFMGKLYFACTNAIVRVDPATRQVEILARNLSFQKPGSFVIKENLMYYFSGDGIYKMNPFLSSFGVEKQDVFPTSVVCELAPGIYTDGNTIADFGSYQVTSYSLGNDPVDFDFICCRDNTVYGVKKPYHLKGETTVTVLSLAKENGIYTLKSQESYTPVMPLHDPYQYYSYYGIFIRYIDALADSLYLQCDYIVGTSSTARYAGYIPLVMRFNLQTGEFETDCGISNATACYELYSRHGDTLFLLRENLARSQYHFICRKDGVETKIALAKTYIDYAVSGSTGKQHLTHLTAVSEDMVVITYRTGEKEFKTELWKVSEDQLYVLAVTSDVIGDLYRIGDNFYELPVWRSFYSEIGLQMDEYTVTPYYFGDEKIEKGYPTTDNKRRSYTLSPFAEGVRLITSQDSAVEIDGYVPVILSAMYVSDTQQYETVFVESYNSLSDKARVRFVEQVDEDVTTIELPIPYHDVKQIISTRGSEISFSAKGDNILVTTERAFAVEEELIIFSKNMERNRSVRQCHLAVSYDLSEDGTRIFTAGNPDNPATYYVSETDNFEYFPEQNYQMLSDGGQKITGFARHYQDLVFFKDKSISILPYGEVLGNVKRLQDAVGCDMPGSIQVINNDVVFGNSEKGIFLLSLQALSSERNVQPIGINISGKRGLSSFSAEERKQAVSLDFQNRYFLSVGDRVYLWDYGLSPYHGNPNGLSWFEYRNIGASCLFTVGEIMAFCPKDGFFLNLFHGSCNDNGAEIPAFFRTKAFDFGDSTGIKAVDQLWLSMNANRDTELTLECADEKEIHSCVPLLFRKTRMANAVTSRLKLRRILFLSLKLGNCRKDTAFDISGIKLEFRRFKSKR